MLARPLRLLLQVYGRQFHPPPYHCRAVEALGDGPWTSEVFGFLLHLARREVNAHRHGIVVAMGKLDGNALAQTTDAHHHLCFVVDAPHEVGHKERFPVLQQCRVSLGEYHRLLSLALILLRYQ